MDIKNSNDIAYVLKDMFKDAIQTMLSLNPKLLLKLKEYLPTIKLGSIKILKSSLEKFLENNLVKVFSILDDIKELKITMEDGDIVG